MRTPPTDTYQGLTLILDKPSRFDTQSGHLLSGPAGTWIEEVLTPLSLRTVDIRDVSTARTPLLPNTRAVALLGEQAAKLVNTTAARHGYPVLFQGRPATVAFYPQDCCDHRSIESADDDDDNDDATTDAETKDSMPTKRSNYRFWTAWHLHKLLAFQSYSPPPVPQIRPYAQMDELVKVLNSTNDNEDIYLDIETSRQHRCLTCIGFSTTRTFPVVYVVPVYRYNGAIAYHDFHRFFRALSCALSRTQAVIHNASFDLTVLHGFYKFILPKSVYDTMLANHRIVPEAEKSLAHVIAQWTWQGYHKDQNTEAWNTDTEFRLWQYNGRDVYNLKLIKDAQLAYAANDPGLLASIQQVNDSVIPYLENSLIGLRVDMDKLIATEENLTTASEQYARVVRILLDIADFNPGSSKQCANYFHNKLHYPVVARSEKTSAPKLGKKQLYQLQLKHNNPAIPFILRYRKAAKDASMLESELFSTPIPK